MLAGRVAIEETNYGIRDLQVVLFLEDDAPEADGRGRRRIASAITGHDGRFRMPVAERWPSDSRFGLTVEYPCVTVRRDDDAPGNTQNGVLYEVHNLEIAEVDEDLIILVPSARAKGLEIPRSRLEAEVKSAKEDIGLLEEQQQLRSLKQDLLSLTPKNLSERIARSRLDLGFAAAEEALSGFNLLSSRHTSPKSTFVSLADDISETTSSRVETLQDRIGAREDQTLVIIPEEYAHVLNEDHVLEDEDDEWEGLSDLTGVSGKTRSAPGCRRKTTIANLCPIPDEVQVEAIEPGQLGAEHDQFVDQDVALEEKTSALGSLILDLLNGQLRSLSGNFGFENGRHTSVSLGEAIEAMYLPPGPADVTAFHDFNVLQVALDDVWSAVLDGKIGQDAKMLYGQWAALKFPEAQADLFRDMAKNESRPLVKQRLLDMATECENEARVGIGDPPAQISDIDELEQFLEQIDAFLVSENAEGSEGLQVTLEAEVGAFRVHGLFVSGVVHHADQSPESADVSQEDSPDPTVRRAAHLQRLRILMEKLRSRLCSPYRFDVFHPEGVNFGTLITYRQKWRPITYQVGDLVASIPLAPGQSTKITAKRVTKKHRAEIEEEKSSASKRLESATKQKDHAEVAAKARKDSKFGFEATAGASYAFGSASATTSYARNQAAESDKAKSRLRESTRKAAEEYRSDRQVKVSVSEEITSEEAEETEIRNPNDEIAVTYLLYELQRRYEVSERIHQVTPVVLVPLEVPAPNEIDDAWIISKAWILRRVLLDDCFEPALDYLEAGLSGDLTRLSFLRRHYEQRFSAVEQLQGDIVSAESLHKVLQDRLAKAIFVRDSGLEGRFTPEEIDNILGTDPDPSELVKFVGNALRRKRLVPATADVEYEKEWATGEDEAEARADETSERLRFSQEGLSSLKSKLAAEVSALEQAQVKLEEALREYFQKSTAVAQFCLHIKENILHYMQAVWEHEPPDQRWLRLYDKRIPWFGYEDVWLPDLESAQASATAQGGDYSVRVYGDEIRIIPAKFVAGVANWKYTQFIEKGTARLVDVADLDRPMGFHGNYLVLPLKEEEAITHYMMKDFRDPVLGVRDPDPRGSADSGELKALLKCVKYHAPDNDEAISELERLIKARENGGDDPEVIVLGSDQLYIEALPSAHPVLENFKLLHRAIDAENARSQLTALNLENLRRAARQVAGDLSDPDVDQRVDVNSRSWDGDVNLDVGDPD